ncbi:MAG: hypothetical protein NDI90_04795 [Nitrospira sp. BO4]|nr:hypothetical protein [Nitrospira sp. BO4]
MVIQNRLVHGLGSGVMVSARSYNQRSAASVLGRSPSFHSRYGERGVTDRLVLLAIWWLVAVVGCGPGTSGEPGASVAPTSGVAEDHRGVTPVSPPTPIARASSSSLPMPSPRQEPVVPDWIATALASPDVSVRLQALDRWVQQGQTGSVDPLMLALNDPDERVQTRALQLIEEDWVRAQAVEE